ncbi:homologous-pairing protein 2 homolog isoform X2 [Amyelois transitella]|uniref:homologous-pairing protein 2 homolog isoform X2 n=1 Tax=Amyelois transitella TaxID=680683 RepID=UPI0029903552|nr:homologous-pairing protein 2 homolog isoform X2 [Amyelois transitella]
MANEAVLKYLTDTNRPYSCADVTVNLRGAFTKSAIQKALDYLSENGKIKCKLYGKQKVYAIVQTDVVVEGDNDIDDYDNLVKTLTQSIADKSNSLKTAEANLKQLTAAPTTDSAKVQIQDIKNKLQKLQNKLDTLRSSSEIVSTEEKKIILSEHDKFLREYSQKKVLIRLDNIQAVVSIIRVI